MKLPSSVRPPLPRFTSECGGGLGEKVGAKVEYGNQMRDLTCASAVFPVRESDEPGNVEEPVGDEHLEAIDEEEDAVCGPCLPTPYQPTRSEYLDHCVTHYPFRAWCRHCLEGRGREFGHDCHSGTKEPGAAPVVSFDYAFIGDKGEIATEEEFTAAG